MPDIRTGLMCRKCRDWPKIERRLATRKEWGRVISRMFHEGVLADDDMLAVLMRLENPEILDRLAMPPPIDLTVDGLLELVGIK